MKTENELITFEINSKTKAKELYQFINKNLPFDTVMELYKLLNRKIENLEDDWAFDFEEKKVEE